jgi:AraC family transcriptional activator FtrA
MLADDGFAAKFPLVKVTPEANVTESGGLICSGGSLAAVDACFQARQCLAGFGLAQAVAGMLVT